jgi:hypothetical protein
MVMKFYDQLIFSELVKEFHAFVEMEGYSPC